MYSSLIIHEHDLKIGIFENKYDVRYSWKSNFQIYKKGDKLNLNKNYYYTFYCKNCNKNNLENDNFNDYYIYSFKKHNESSFIQFKDYFNFGFILLGNEDERNRYIYDYFNDEIRKLKKKK